MKNPNSHQLDERTIKYWMKKPSHVEKMIQKLKGDISKIPKSNMTKLMDKMDNLAQWRYIRWRIKHSEDDKERVIFT